MSYINNNMPKMYSDNSMFTKIDNTPNKTVIYLQNNNTNHNKEKKVRKNHYKLKALFKAANKFHTFLCPSQTRNVFSLAANSL